MEKEKELIHASLKMFQIMLDSEMEVYTMLQSYLRKFREEILKYFSIDEIIEMFDGLVYYDEDNKNYEYTLNEIRTILETGEGKITLFDQYFESGFSKEDFEDAMTEEDQPIEDWFRG